MNCFAIGFLQALRRSSAVILAKYSSTLAGSEHFALGLCCRICPMRSTRRSRRSPDEHKEHTNMKPKNTICIWFDKDAHEAASFYSATFPDSRVNAVHKAPGDYPGGKQGDVLTVEFTVLGIPCLGLNGGPAFKHSEAFSF